ncbi:tRNA (cytosine(34)-C(5))-methyltransferase-like isoform X2 [Tigriopus californicus]|uniref:tRNA (cytosine(34)-C(5))-methyltransferase-like isoform X2 n=1 Tax=Tigriopus californicus TaxID=6832 RepID=UPI0027DA75AA|nr:tRNA (cytosine(34)-C(5))-methyltransferase-like isoform X2 [Tigriopus californicus]
MGGIRRNKRRQNHDKKPRDPSDWSGHKDGRGYKDILRENAKFVDFYRAQKLTDSEEELQEMVRAFQRDLPASFRITGFRSQAVAVRNIIESQFFRELAILKEQQAAESGDCPVVEPKCLTWYPDRMAWQLNLSRKDIRREEAYFKLHNFLISETDSGNISRQETVSMIPTLVLDVQSHHKVLDMCAAPGSKTAQLIEAIHSDETQIPEGLVVANDSDNSRCYLLVHQAKRLQSSNFIVTNHDATIFPKIHLTQADGSSSVMKFDRVLCDAPCSGDGTMRKNADIWPKWNGANSCNLHGIQYRVAKRGLELLAVGGKMVYSTCSLNPVEDEAVIARILSECEDTVELVDVSAEVPGLKFKPGLSQWVLADKENKFYAKFDEVPEVHHSLMRPSMFPPPVGEVEKLHLERCMRILPHQQDTGGFFVACLQKKAPCPWENKKTYETSEKNENGKRPNADDETRTNPKKKQSRYQGFKEDPFIYLKKEDAETEFEEVKNFFEVSDVLRKEMFLTRCATSRKNLYFTSMLVRNILESNQDRLKVINTGVKAFAKCENKGSPCALRLAQEGSLMTIPFIKKRIVTPTKADLETMLLANDIDLPPKIADLSEVARNQLNALITGSIALIYEEKEDGKTSLLVELVGWKGKETLRAYVPKNERIHFLRLIGGDTSKFEKNKFDIKRGIQQNQQKSDPEVKIQEPPQSLVDTESIIQKAT